MDCLNGGVRSVHWVWLLESQSSSIDILRSLNNAGRYLIETTPLYTSAMSFRLFAFTFAALCASTFLAPAAFLWIEGEAPTTSTVQKHGWYSSVKKDVLSGNDWLSHYGDKPGEATYQVEAPEAGSYTLWVRVNPVASEPKWKVDGAEWQAVTLGTVQQQQNIASDGKIDHRFIGWVKIGALQLAKGRHTVGFRFEGPVANSGGLDCFVLTTEKFVPQGTMKPSEGGAAVAAGGPGDWFPLLAEDDTFDARSVIDMSKLVPAPAGQFGVLKAVGKDLKFEKAPSPVKLWGVGANVSPGRYSREQLTQRAKYLRKFGVNIVRQHPLFDELSSDGKIDPKKLDEYDWWFAELKKHGIYTDWSVFYHFQLGRDAGYPLFDDLEGRGRCARHLRRHHRCAEALGTAQQDARRVARAQESLHRPALRRRSGARRGRDAE